MLKWDKMTEKNRRMEKRLVFPYSLIYAVTCLEQNLKKNLIRSQRRNAKRKLKDERQRFLSNHSKNSKSNLNQFHKLAISYFQVCSKR